MQVLHSILTACYPTGPAGKRVVMKATISGVDIFAMAYAWSNKGINYIISSYGKIVHSKNDYQSNFADAYGNTKTRLHAQPAIAHMLYMFLPLINEHNKAQQNALELERCWLTKDCWFRLEATVTGAAVVDLQRWDCCK